jgi:hypothetical protein
MANDGVGETAVRLAQPGPPDAAGFAALLGAPLQPSDENPDWTFYTFVLPDGPLAGGVLRLNAAGDGALLSLSPRDPPGVTEAEVDTSAWGLRVDAVPRPRLEPEGGDLLTYQLGEVKLSVLWTHVSRRLINLALEWPGPPITEEPEPMAEEDDEAA